jgi:hypothetical protein
MNCHCYNTNMCDHLTKSQEPPPQRQPPPQVHLISVSTFVSRIILTIRYQALLYEKAFDEKQRENKEWKQVRCLQMHLPMSSMRSCIKSLAHVVAVTVETSATVVRRLSLQIHHHRRLRPRHTGECWSCPRPIPPTGRWIDRFLGPQRPSKGSSGRVVCHPRLGLSQPGCIGPWPIVIGPSGEGDGEDEDDERQISVVTDPVGAPVIHRTTRISIGPRGRPQGSLAPRTATNLANPFPHRTGTTAGTSFKRSRPFGLRDTSRSKTFMRQLAAPSLHPPPGPSGKGWVSESWDSTVGPSRWAGRGRGGVAPRNMSGEGSMPKEVTKWKNKTRRARSGGCEPPSPMRQVAPVDRRGKRQPVWCAIRENLTGATGTSPLILPHTDASRPQARPVAWVTVWASLGLGSASKSVCYYSH